MSSSLILSPITISWRDYIDNDINGRPESEEIRHREAEDQKGSSPRLMFLQLCLQKIYELSSEKIRK